MNPDVGLLIALNHERYGRLRCLVRVAGIEGRCWIILKAKLEGLRYLWSGKFGNDAESEINSRRDTTRGEDVPIAHYTPLFVCGAHQG